MGKRGPAGQPTALVKAKGYYRPSKHGDEVQETGKLVFVNDQYPIAPEEFSESQAKYWNGAIGQFVTVKGWVAHSDLFMFKQWCILASELDELNRLCEIEERVIFNVAGNKVVNPIFKLRETTRKDFKTFCDSFGLSPSSRSSIKLEQSNDKKQEEDYTL